jgi:sugar O-acyltransferase (sialic acid O-acetyltransferase NeuD family)
LLVLGTTPGALVFVDAFSDVAGFEVAGFVENLDRERCRAPLGGLPVHWVDDIAPFAKTHLAACCLWTTFRDRYVEVVEGMGFEFPTLVHPTTYLSRQSTLGAGTSLGPSCTVAGYTQIGRHVQVNRAANIGHHTTIADYVSILPGVNLAGNCRIGSHTYLGIGATILDGIRVGSHSVIGGGAVVTKDVPDHVLAVGVPAKVVKEGVPGK